MSQDRARFVREGGTRGLSGMFPQFTQTAAGHFAQMFSRRPPRITSFRKNIFKNQRVGFMARAMH
jgi:hypothetical protein